MNKKIRNIILSALIFLFAAFIFLYKLEKIPNGFYVDEAAVAYNAYSILKTGKDIFGQSYPILFRLLGSYTPPIYIYISSIFIKFLGMEAVTFRVISAISAIVSIFFFYIFLKKMKLFKSDISYFAVAFFYAITPWLVFNARLGYEVTLAYLLFNIGVYFLFVALEKPRNFILGIIFLSLSTYTAHTQRFLAPIFLLFYLLIFRSNIFKRPNFKYLISSLIIAFIVQIPHFMVITTPAFWVKNQRLVGSGGFIKNIFNQALTYVSPGNIFVRLEDIDQQHIIPEISVMYKWMVIPFFIGLFILTKRFREKSYKFILLLFVTTLIPAVLSGEFISIQRALPFLLPLSLVIGIGIDEVGSHLNKYVNIILFFAVTFYSLLMLYRSYFVLFPIEQADAWNYGYKELSAYINSKPDVHFVIDNTRNPRNYILLLYYLRYPPENYQKEVEAKYTTDYYRSLPPENEYKFSNIEVRPINWEKDAGEDCILVGDKLSISEGQAIEHNLIKINVINDPMQNNIIISYKTNPSGK